MIFSGVSPNGRLVEIIELADHPWFVASQFHPEFRSRPNRAHPLFRDFVRAAFLQSGIDQMELRPVELLEETETS
jgi:CTP synthase